MTENDDAFIFQATHEGVPVTIGHATRGEVKAMEGPVGVAVGYPPDDTLDHWNLIVIRSSPATTLHALGWRRIVANTWLTTRIVAIDTTMDIVRTRSGAAYYLNFQYPCELDPDLRAHLAYGLRMWGYKDIQP